MKKQAEEAAKGQGLTPNRSKAQQEAQAKHAKKPARSKALQRRARSGEERLPMLETSKLQSPNFNAANEIDPHT